MLAVGVGVHPQPVAQAGGEQLTKVVLYAVGARAQHDAADDVVARNPAADHARRVLAVGIGSGLRLAHRVGARHQAHELVEAVDVGGRRDAHRVAQAVRAGQRERDAANRRLGVAHAVVAHVLVHITGDVGLLVHARIQRGVVLALGQRDDLRLGGGGVGVRVDRIKAVGADVGSGKHRARRRVTKPHLVLDPRGQPGEGIDAVSNRDRVDRGVVAGGDDQAVRAATDQGDRAPDDAGLAAVLLAVGVGVHPQPVADARELDQPRVPAQVVLARDQRGHDGQAGGRVRVAVTGVHALVRGGEVVARRLDERHFVVTRHQVREPVVARVAHAVVGRRRARHQRAVRAQQVHRHAVDAAGRAVVLLAVEVVVRPDVVAQAGVFVETRVDCLVVLTRRQHDHVRHQAIAVDVGGGTGIGLPWARCVETRRGAEQHLVVQPRSQAIEAVGTKGIGKRGGENFGWAEASQAVHFSHQLDLDATDAKLARVLDSVAVEVVPDKVAQFGGLGLDDQRLVTAAVGVDRIENDAEGLANIGHITIIGQRQRNQVGDRDGILRAGKCV